MSQERVGVATQLRAEGEERICACWCLLLAAGEIVIPAEAYRDAERISGAGDARAAGDLSPRRTRKTAISIAFYRSMQAYRESIGGDQDVLVLKPDNESSVPAESGRIHRRLSGELLR